MRWGLVVTVGIWSTCASCTPSRPPPTREATAPSTHAKVDDRPEADAQAARLEIAELMYDGKLVNGWQDWGWSPRELKDGAAARLRFDNWGGWMLAKPGLTGSFGGVVFRVKLPPGEAEFQQLYLESSGGGHFPKVNVLPEDHRDVGDGWSEVFIPMSRLNPEDVDFERVAFHTTRKMGTEWILIDKVALTKATSQPAAIPTYDRSTLTRVNLSVDCRAKATKISPMIYGINQYTVFDAKRTAAQWLLGAASRRWGGNASTDYNWQVAAWNTGGDWFYEDVEAPAYRTFLKETADHGMFSALTVPTIGWVAKDRTSFSFPVSTFGPQQSTDQWRKDAGNGKDSSGKELRPGPPGQAYVAAPPEFIGKWVEAIQDEDKKAGGTRSVGMYILDNEPGLWWRNHRDIHPEPVSYDELVQRTIAYGTAIRRADPHATIAGPAEWGWMNFMYSAKDQSAGPLVLHPDRRTHGDLPVIAYYLKALAEHEKKTGVRVLDVLDLHAYPTTESIYAGATDPDKAALRIRSTRFLWDPSYVDESWIAEPIELIPRMRRWVDAYYPGLALSIGEWAFGAEEHMSSGLAIAEALGHFGQLGLHSAFYWVYPPEKTPAAWAFRAYRNYDGKGGRFLDWSEPATGTRSVSIFASRDDAGTHLVSVVLNLSPTEAVVGNLDLSSCGKVASEQAYVYFGRSSGFAAAGQESQGQAESPSVLSEVLPPYSITVLDVRLADPTVVAQ
jgi:hypothetical protein